MWKNKKVVSITPVGRSRYIDMLFPYLLKNNNIIDEHIFWNNTDSVKDIEYIEKLCQKYSEFFKFDKKNTFDSLNYKKMINYIYFLYNESNTIYIKINDDICWMSEDCIPNLLNFRTKYENFFLVYPMIVNSGRTDFIYQVMGYLPLKLSDKSPISYRDEINLADFPAESSHIIHKCFINLIKKDKIKDLLIEKYIINNYERIPEHMVCWFGESFQKMNNQNIYDLNCFSELEPKSRGQYSCFCGSSVVSHFSHLNHEEILYSCSDIVFEYENLSKKIMKDIERK
jgi:hypothetical protein